MHNYNQLSTLFIGFCCFQSVYAMELVNCTDKKNHVAVDMPHFWSDDYSKDINAIKDVDLKSMRQHLKKEDYLSPHAKALDHLLYLSTIRQNNTVKTLFTHKQQNKFDMAFKVRRFVPWGFAFNGAVIGVTALFPFTSFTGLSQCSNATQSECLSQTVTMLTPTIISAAGALVVGLVSLYATGLSPDLSSRKANTVQNEIGHLNPKYATVAKYWIDIYFNCPEKAQWIVDKFDIEELKARAQQKTYKAKLGSSLVNPLEEAWHFIKHNTILVTFTEIESYIYYKISCRRIESLEKESKIYCRHIEDFSKRIASLEKIVHEKDAEIDQLKQENI